MHKDWIQDALINAPDNVDENMTIQEYVDAYSKLSKATDNLCDVLIDLWNKCEKQKKEIILERIRINKDDTQS